MSWEAARDEATRRCVGGETKWSRDEGGEREERGVRAGCLWLFWERRDATARGGRGCFWACGGSAARRRQRAGRGSPRQAEPERRRRAKSSVAGAAARPRMPTRRRERRRGRFVIAAPSQPTNPAEASAPTPHFDPQPSPSPVRPPRPPKLSAPSQAVPEHYALLGVAPSASAAQIKAAYHRLILQHHPDRVTQASAGSSASRSTADQAEQARLLNAAWATLSQPDKRAAYDEQRAKQRSKRLLKSSPSC